MKLSPHARTVNALLETKGYTLSDFISDRRDEGMSWQRIARALYDFTDEVVDVTGETIRVWGEQIERSAA